MAHVLVGYGEFGQAAVSAYLSSRALSARLCSGRSSRTWWECVIKNNWHAVQRGGATQHRNTVTWCAARSADAETRTQTCGTAREFGCSMLPRPVLVSVRGATSRARDGLREVVRGGKGLWMQPGPIEGTHAAGRGAGFPNLLRAIQALNSMDSLEVAMSTRFLYMYNLALPSLLAGFRKVAFRSDRTHGIPYMMYAVHQAGWLKYLVTFVRPARQTANTNPRMG
jgi:hypothetical protein